MTTTRLLRRRQVIDKTGLSSATIDRLEAVALFPKRVIVLWDKNGRPTAVRWPEDQIEDWCRSR